MTELRTVHNEDDSQERILRAYTVLRLLRPDWGGALMICCGLGPQGAALAMAANIAGAVCLSIEERPELLKASLRSGSCDFIVNTLDEALRAMKNEIRKHLPLSVGLQGKVGSVLLECLERGVQPELVIDLTEESATHLDSVQQLQHRGALVASFEEGTLSEGIVDISSVLDNFVREQQWVLRSFEVSDAAALRAFDARALRLLADEDALRLQWLRSASRSVQRQRPLRRVLWLTFAEQKSIEEEAT